MLCKRFSQPDCKLLPWLSSGSLLSLFGPDLLFGLLLIVLSNFIIVAFDHSIYITFYITFYVCIYLYIFVSLSDSSKIKDIESEN